MVGEPDHLPHPKGGTDTALSLMKELPKRSYRLLGRELFNSWSKERDAWLYGIQGVIYQDHNNLVPLSEENLPQVAFPFSEGVTQSHEPCRTSPDAALTGMSLKEAEPWDQGTDTCT